MYHSPSCLAQHKSSYRRLELTGATSLSTRLHFICETTDVNLKELLASSRQMFLLLARKLQKQKFISGSGTSSGHSQTDTSTPMVPKQMPLLGPVCGHRTSSLHIVCLTVQLSSLLNYLLYKIPIKLQPCPFGTVQ